MTANVFGKGPGIGVNGGIFPDRILGAVLILFRSKNTSDNKAGRKPASRTFSSQERSRPSGASRRTPDSQQGAARKAVGQNEGLQFLVQDWRYELAERQQEVVTLAETEHIYTFGRILGRATVTGFFINGNTALGKQQGNNSHNVIPSWEDRLRAKISGLEQNPTAIVSLDALNEILLCVATNISLGASVQREALVDGTIQLIVLDKSG